MSNKKSKGYTINYKWDLKNSYICPFQLLSSKWFTLENYDKIFFSMSLLKYNGNCYCLKIHKKGIFEPETVKITIKYSSSEIKKKITDWENDYDVECQLDCSNLEYIDCEIHLDNIDFEWTDHRILSKPSSIPMNKYLLSPQYSDITIRIKDIEEELPAHKVVLAFHSCVFEAMFNSNMKEAKENYFYFGEFDITTVKEVLQFMYTGKMTQENNVDLLFKILACASMYQIEKLKIYSELKLILCMNVDNIIKILITIENLEVPRLKEKAELYLECNNDRISLIDAVKEMNNSKILFNFLAMKTRMKIN